jgi:AraC-like DNA-binding protein
MDVLSDVISVARSGQPRSAKVTWHAPWAQEFASVPGSAGFQIILQGTSVFRVPGADPVLLTPGDVVFLPRGAGHTLADGPTTLPTGPACDPDDPQRSGLDVVGEPTDGGAPATVTLCGAYQLDPGRAHPLLRDLPEVIHLPAHLGRHPELRAVVDLLAAELDGQRLGRSAIVPALLDTLLVYILRGWFDGRPVAGWSAALGDPATVAALHAMHGDPARAWTVATLAAEAGLSRASFARRFAGLVGRPPLNYLTWWRMTTAARLLRESDAPLATVAREVGYSSEFAFASAFKRRYAVAPGRYRREGRVGVA